MCFWSCTLKKRFFPIAGIFACRIFRVRGAGFNSFVFFCEICLYFASSMPSYSITVQNCSIGGRQWVDLSLVDLPDTQQVVSWVDKRCERRKGRGWVNRKIKLRYMICEEPIPLGDFFSPCDLYHLDGIKKKGRGRKRDEEEVN